MLAPTRELAARSSRSSQPLARARALSVAAVYGGVGLERQAARAATRPHPRRHARAASRTCSSAARVTLAHVRFLVLDEADRMLDMGFKPALDRIVSLTPKDRQTLFFSATLEGAAGAHRRRTTRATRPATRTRRRPSNARVEHRFVAPHARRKLAALVAELRRRTGRTLVFVRTKRGADRLVKRLKHHACSASPCTANKSQPQRQKALDQFEAGRVETLVATDVAARGIDVDDVTQVINFDAPPDREAYVHRVGRTGRAGATAPGSASCSPSSATTCGAIAEDLGLDREFERSISRS